MLSFYERITNCYLPRVFMIELPPSPMWKDFSYGVRVGITLSAAFSNIIDIDVFVADCGAMESCKAQLEEFSNVSIHRKSYQKSVLTEARIKKIHYCMIHSCQLDYCM